ncbi:MAG: ABC transporter ATP-binding protein [Gemmatimonadetes bacterium]|nr:ABC transporter ATP-binding protein [Gemmatimonadota bacterium]NNM04236.1 ABC transporter ATP-binding protein [Gemmatimonadota bacterium]
MRSVVSLDGLSRAFGSELAVEGLTFQVGRGELFGLVGPDGAGKTTTLRILGGVLPPTSGRAIVCGIDVGEDPEGAKPHIAYMSQQFGLYQDLTVRENIEFYADLYRVPKGERAARLDRLYAFSNLGPFQERLAGNLSGGMKQKLSLSCALIHQPEVLLLDEPTFGVDPISRRDLWLILHEMVEEGVTVIVSTSYLDEAERCDRVALLNEGRVLALDTPGGLLSLLPGALASVRLSDPRGARDFIRTLPESASTALFGNSVHVLLAGGPEGRDQLESRLEASGFSPESVEMIEPSLEDVFLHLVREE